MLNPLHCAKKVCFALVLCLTLHFSATAQDNRDNTTATITKTYQPAIGKPGGERTIAILALPQTFNIYLAGDTSSTDVLSQMYLGLLSTNAATTQVEPDLAESWAIGPDKRTYTFKLKKNLKWSDGQPLTADDVVFTYNDIINNPHIPNNYRDGLLVDNQFPKVAKIDSHTVSFTIPKPFVPFLRGLSDPIMPRHVFGRAVKPDDMGSIHFLDMWGLKTEPHKIVCNGPWKLKAYVAGQRVVLEPNPYSPLKDIKGQPLPYLKKFTFLEAPLLDNLVEKFQAQETDALSLRPEDYVKLAPEQKKNNFTVYNLGAATGTTFVMFNMSTATNAQGQPVVNPIRSAWFRDKRFRQALAHAIDKESIMAHIYHGQATPQISHISQQNPFYKPTTKAYAYNLAQAKQLLMAAGYKYSAQGALMDAKGNRVEFNLVTNEGNEQRDAMSIMLQKDWGKLGIKVNYQAVSFSTLVQQIDQDLNWEAMLIGLTGSAIEPHFGVNTWRLDGRMHMFNMGHPQKWTGKKGTTFEPWEKEVFALYEKAATEFDPEKRKALYWQTQDIVADQLPFLYTVNQNSLLAIRNNIGNLFPALHGGSGLNQVNWNTAFQFIK